MNHVHRDLKKQARTTRKAEERELRKQLRAFRRQQIKCWWSRPWGHEWVNAGTAVDPDWICVACDKERYLVYHVCEDVEA